MMSRKRRERSPAGASASKERVACARAEASCCSGSPPITLQNPNQYQWVDGDPKESLRAAHQVFRNLNTVNPNAGGGSLDFLQRTALNAQVSSDQIRAAAARYHTTVSYPTTGQLGPSLKLIASLIAGGLGSRVFYASITGFDTHSGQQAQQPQLLTHLAAASRAFYEDLKAQGNADQRALLTFSAFRRPGAENAR